MATTVIIGKPNSEHISITVTERTSDDWLLGALEVSAGPWSGSCKASFYRGELRRFASEFERLYRDLTGHAQLITMERNLELTVTGDGKGHLVAEGRVRDSFAPDGTYLAFSVGLDQTDLPAIIAAINAADAE